MSEASNGQHLGAQQLNGSSNGAAAVARGGGGNKVAPAGGNLPAQHTKQAKKPRSPIVAYINDFFHGSGAYLPAAWLADFSHRPSWCDASMSLQQVKRGKAHGFELALRFRSVLQKILFTLGRTIQYFWPVFIIVLTAILFIFCSGLRDVVIQIDIVKLWVEDNGDLNAEMQYLNTIAREFDVNRIEGDGPTTPASIDNETKDDDKFRVKRANDKPKPNKRRNRNRNRNKKKKNNEGPFARPEQQPGTDINGGFTLFIQTPRRTGQSILNKKDLLLHAELMVNISRLGVDWGGHKWTLTDLCFKPPPPKMGGQFAAVAQPIVDNMIPCVFITPLDCFWDGSRPMGPDPPIELPAFLGTLIENLPTGSITWKNLNPQQMFDAVKSFMGDLGVIGNQLDRAGMGDGYLSRPCIDNLNLECPRTAPNAIDYCAIIDRLQRWEADQPANRRFNLTKDDVPKSRAEVEKRSQNRRQSAYDNYDEYEELYASGNWTEDEPEDFEDDDFGFGSLFGSESDEVLTDDPRPRACRQHINAVNEQLRTNADFLSTFVKSAADRDRLYPPATAAFYGAQLTGGCDGFARNILGWPEELLIGGQKYDATGNMTHAESFQTVMLLGNGADIYQRYKDGFGYKQDIKDNRNWSPQVAGRLLADWQRLFTRHIFNHINNTDEIDERQTHPLAGTSISDMMAEFSKFKYGIILSGYLLMFLYAGMALFSFGHRGVDSCSGLAFTGVILVTIASAAGLGVSTMMGIEFNAVTTQIVPFLALGLGVDDMFLLVENYVEIVKICHHDELGFLLKETGLSVLLTSISNILAFLSGSLLPIPAMRSFCQQTAILLFFNVIIILTLYPAIMAIDIIRRKHALVDILCCLKGRARTPQASAMNTKGHSRAASDAVPKDGQYHMLPPSNSDARLQGSVNPAAEHSNSANGSAKPPTGHSPPPPYELSNGIKVNAATELPPPTADGWEFSLHCFVKHVYIPLLYKFPVKVGVLVISLLMVVFGIWGTLQVNLGLELSDVIPKGTPEYDFLLARERYFSFYPMYGVVRQPTDFPNKQLEMQAFRNAIRDIPYTVTGASVLAEKYWYTVFRGWVEDMYGEVKALRGSPLANRTWVDTKGLSEKQVLAYALSCQAGDKADCSQFDTVEMVFTDASSSQPDELQVNKAAFYNYLTAWFGSEQMMYYVTQGNFFPPPPKWAFNMSEPGALIPPALPLQYTQIPFFLNDLVDTPPIVDMIKQVRAVCTRFTEEHELHTFPSGIPFTFWHQYLALKQNLAIALLIISGAVFVVISSLLMNPWTGACVLFVLLVNLVELAGFMGLVGLKLNPVSAVTLIVAVGIGVEFTVHVSLSYLTTLGTANERLAGTLNHMFVPVVHGGVSTFLGIIMLAFSEFEFIIRYFFLVMVMLVLLGMWNGLALLPVVLAFFGPPSEVRPTDGGNALEPPPLPQDDMQVAMMDNGKWLEPRHAATSPPSNAVSRPGIIVALDNRLICPACTVAESAQISPPQPSI